MEVKRENILSLEIDSESDVGVCRRKSASMALKMGFDEVNSGEVAIMVSELVTNVLKHGGGKGKILICHFEDADSKKAIEVWCCDSGKGIHNLEEAMQDGYSRKNSLGLGLGTIRRFSDLLEMNPVKPTGFETNYFAGNHNFNHCIRALKWVPVKSWMGVNKKLVTGAVSQCAPGEQLNGDAYLINHTDPDTTVASVIDGLGHGREANLASVLAKEQIIHKSDLPVDNLMKHVHNSIRGTRGATVGLARINTENNTLAYSGIGNIESFIMAPEGKKTLLSFGGIIGHNMRTPRVFELDFKPGDTLCMYSDGITTRWRPEELDWSKPPQENAEFILNQYSRHNDDATVLIIRYSS